jgi:hypothetical protein
MSRMLRNKLQEVRKLGETLHPASVTKLILDELQIDERDTAEPLFQFRMLAMYRTALLSVKEYFDLEAYIKSMYLKLKLDGAFTKADQQTEQGFLFLSRACAIPQQEIQFCSSKHCRRLRTSCPISCSSASPYYLKMISLRAAIEANQRLQSHCPGTHAQEHQPHQEDYRFRGTVESDAQLLCLLFQCR